MDSTMNKSALDIYKLFRSSDLDMESNADREIKTLVGVKDVREDCNQL